MKKIASLKSRRKDVKVLFIQRKRRYKIEFLVADSLNGVEYANEAGNNGFQLNTDISTVDNGTQFKLNIHLNYTSKSCFTSKKRGYGRLFWKSRRGGTFCFYIKDNAVHGFSAFIPNKLGTLEFLNSKAPYIGSKSFSDLVNLCIKKIRNLFKVGFHEVMCYDENDEGRDLAGCLVCFFPKYFGQRISILPCGHRFHEICLRKRLASYHNCPICEKPVEKEALFITKNKLIEEICI